MASGNTYHERVIVLRKTRLRESDLVLTMLAEDGRQVRAVAKGAQKPSSPFASRLELFAEAEVLLVRGRSLDIVKEARLEEGHAPLRFDYGRSVCAAPVAELLALATQDELPVPRLHAMACAALAALDECDMACAPLVTVAFLLKASSILGFRPSLSHCVGCAAPRARGEAYPFSFEAGGVLCGDCAQLQGARDVPAGVEDWADSLIHATFAEVGRMEADSGTQRLLVRFARSWTQAHIATLKSLPFVLTALG